MQSIMLRETLELDIETGRLLFEWNSLDHVQPDGEDYSRSLLSLFIQILTLF
jgi:hypothetical protein